MPMSAPVHQRASDAGRIPAGALPLPARAGSRWYRAGMTRRSERIFNVVSAFFILVIAIGWSWSIATARSLVPATAADSTGMLSPITSGIASALTETDAPSTAYLTDALTEKFVPLRGESGRLRAVIGPEGAPIVRDTLPNGVVITYTAGGQTQSSPQLRAPSAVGVWQMAVKFGNAVKPIADLSVITLRPATDKRRGRIGLYYIGNWPEARGAVTARASYAPPQGFIEVTPENQNTLVSDHFRLRDFLPHDQRNVWPKYLVLDTKLVDKLELILEDLREKGVNTRGVRVMSGFRTPQYNTGVGSTAGRASLSRHMYGDAADIYIDSNGDGNMDDLNRDGRIDIRDAEFIRQAGERVERAHPRLIGGIGVYRANPVHGPFTHVDTRGYRARW